MKLCVTSTDTQTSPARLLKGHQAYRMSRKIRVHSCGAKLAARLSMFVSSRDLVQESFSSRTQWEVFISGTGEEFLMTPCLAGTSHQWTCEAEGWRGAPQGQPGSSCHAAGSWSACAGGCGKTRAPLAPLCLPGSHAQIHRWRGPCPGQNSSRKDALLLL